MKYFVYNVRHM